MIVIGCCCAIYLLMEAWEWREVVERCRRNKSWLMAVGNRSSNAGLDQLSISIGGVLD